MKHLIEHIFEAIGLKNKPTSSLPKIHEKITQKKDILEISNNETATLLDVLFDEKNADQHFVVVKNVTFIKCLFTKKHISQIKFHGCKFISCIFNGSRINSCEFHHCTFDESCFFKTELNDTYLDPKSFKFSSKWMYKWANVNAWWFHVQYRNAMHIHQETFAMHADVKFQFYRRYEYLFGKHKRPLKFLGGLLYDLTLGYGYGVINALITTCMMIAGFAVLMQPDTSLGTDANMLKAIYFSVVSFTTVGYGEVTPLHTSIALAVTTVFLIFSVIWGSLVTAVIIKRLVK